MEIIDDFLEQKEFSELHNVIMGDQFIWCYNDVIDYSYDIDKYQFVHYFYKIFTPVSPFIEIVKPIIQIIDPVSLVRIKANLLTRTSNIIENEFHTDIDDLLNFPEKLKQFTTSIFYVNTNNGYTKFEDGTKVESVANRMVTFPYYLKHRGTSCTDEKTRVIINFNYFGLK